jgi:hypothetical protein
MKFFRYCLLAILLAYGSLAQAHVGSPEVSYQGKAGKYKVLINISPPDVIPGVAIASIYIEGYTDEKVYVQTQYYLAGKKGSVDPEMAIPVNGAKGWFQCSAWLMMSGAADLEITVVGHNGKGSVIVPVMAVATSARKMPRLLGTILVTLGILLVVLMVTIIGASVSDGLVKPGTDDKRFKRKKAASMLVTFIIILGVLVYGAKWCKNERSTLLTLLYRPIQGRSKVFKYNGQNVLHLWVDNSALKYVHEPLSLVVPDHGKLMHLVLVKEKTFDVFAHLHPIRQDSLDFLVNLPGLPAGRYFLYGDIVSWNGFSETIIDTVQIPQNPAIQTAGLNNITIKTSPDDAWLIGTPVTVNSNKPVSICGIPGMCFTAQDGTTITWEHKMDEPVKAKKFIALTFHVQDAQGKPAPLQLYMGMAGHAIVIKYDGSVYAHLHPVGNFAMASQQVIGSRMGDPNKKLILPDPKRFRDSIDKLITRIDNMTEDGRNDYLMAEMGMGKNMNMGKGMDMPSAAEQKCGSIVQFPYSFPGPGMYRIWMEVKVNGKIITSAFDTKIIN